MENTEDEEALETIPQLKISHSFSTFFLIGKISNSVIRYLYVPIRFNFRYCLDNRKALERDVGYAELQTRLIRYETQTTCTKECCPVPCVLSPLPSPAVLSEPGSMPDGEALQSEFRTETSRLKRRSKDLDCFYPNKR